MIIIFFKYIVKKKRRKKITSVNIIRIEKATTSEKLYKFSHYTQNRVMKRHSRGVMVIVKIVFHLYQAVAKR